MPVCPTCRTKSDDGVTVCPVDGTLLAPSHDLVGRILGDRYRILSRLGQGGMGSIYLAEHVTLGKRMAVKVLRPEYSRDAELLDRFQHEARAASQIGQENIVEVFDFGHTPEGEAYFVMEALDGESLARILHRDGPMPVGRAVPIFLQICRALGAAHERGIVHRDLKPENVFILRRNDGADFVKVLDFGIAKGPGTPDSKRLTKAGSIIGTPEYMSPEQASSNVIDQRSDVYAFGVLAYETLTGRLPFDGDTPLATLMKHQSDAPVPPRRLRPELPPEVEQIVLRALVKRPEGRQLRSQPARRKRRVGLVLHQGGERGVAVEGEPPGQGLVGEHPEGVDVRPVVDDVRRGLLRRHVLRRPDDGADPGEPLRLGRPGPLGDAEVEHLHEVAAVGPAEDEDVLRLQVAVHDAALVRRPEGPADLQEDGDRPGQRHRPVPVEDARQALPVERLHDEVGLPLRGVPEVEDLDDVLLPDLAGGPRLVLEAVHQLGVVGVLGPEHLHGHPLAQRDVLGEVDAPHAPLAQPRQHAVPVAENPADEVVGGGSHVGQTRIRGGRRIRISYHNLPEVRAKVGNGCRSSSS
jgi:tRNA A-37 threonylcarbamoyl transferase component Bud32